MPILPSERNPHRAVYSSSPDRGLQTALELWPLVRAEVPDAELHVFYGFQGLRAIQPSLADALEAKAKATEGVVLHGRIPPRELAHEFLRSGVWFYPTWFSETSCLTAMQAQAAGLYGVTSPIAALKETAARQTLVEGAPAPIDLSRSFELAPCSDDYKAAMVRATVAAMRAAEDGPRSSRLDPDVSLPTLVAEWSEMLASLVTSLELEPVPAFYVAPVFEAAGRAADGEIEAA